MIPNSRPDHRTAILVAMLKDAAINAKPTKYAQNMRHGMYFGTKATRAFAPKRCSAPNTASGAAKHRLLSVVILSRPRASANSFFAAHPPIKRTAIPATHMAITSGATWKNMARMVVYIDLRFGKTAGRPAAPPTHKKHPCRLE